MNAPDGFSLRDVFDKSQKQPIGDHVYEADMCEFPDR